ncbi:MAG TPA: alpha-amlyase [Ignavibacteriales bacterium]|nr:alpha-amlyase [Ignavibacteriales bacterium]
MNRTVFILILFVVKNLFSQQFSIQRIEPPNWWVGMKHDTVQIMIYGKNISKAEIYPQHGPTEIVGVHKAESLNYLFLDLAISPDIKENFNFEIGFSFGSTDTVISYPILVRENSDNLFKGFSQSDVMYLIMADRFCDGNPANNKIDDSLDQFTSKDLNGRKGGDIEGIISKLDYLKDLGITSVWITPMLENNMWMSYHGYAATDLYKIDPRFGSNELYKELVNQAHDESLKIIMDHVSNHIGINHWWMKDLPFASWINGTVENHLPANHNKMTFPDPYSPGESIDLTWDGWFTNYMVDLNQANPFLKKYLIQNAIWWIEYLGIDGIREDTYPYCNQYAMADWNKAILDEYPNFNIVGEIWTGEPAYLAAYQQKNKFGVHLDTHLPCVTDFALSDAFRNYLSGKKGLEGIFNTLAQDFLYYDPNNLLTFFDNHDISRGLFVANNDVEKYKIALTILLTTRGIPKILYGSEIGMVGDNNHGTIRSPFPGGFENDSLNAFSSCDRTEYQNDIFNFTQNLLEIRKNHKSLSQGKLTHFYPFDNVYVYFRETDDESAMIILNGSDKESEVDLNKYKETLAKTLKIENIKTNEVTDITQNKKITIKKKSAEIFLLKK